MNPGTVLGPWNTARTREPGGDTRCREGPDQRGEAADRVRSIGDEAGDRRRICVTPSQEVLPRIS